MMIKSTLLTILMLHFTLPAFAQESQTTAPAELELLKASVGTWDAAIKVWPYGPDSTSIEFNGVDKITAFGEYWLASNFTSEFMGQTTRVHSIAGYDLDEKKLIGKIIDHGPYAAKMIGHYNPSSKAVTWMVHAKAPDGKPILQKSVITHKNPDKRELVLTVPGSEKDQFTKFMQIIYTRRSDKKLSAKAKIRIRKPAAEVFSAFVDGNKMSKFWFTRRDDALEAGESSRWFLGSGEKAQSFEVQVKELNSSNKIVIEWEGYDGKPTQVTWRIEATENDETILSIEETGFAGARDAIIKRALDSTGGFNQVIVAAKAFIEHGIGLNVVESHP